jgi:hypothetical protein
VGTVVAGGTVVGVQTDKIIHNFKNIIDNYIQQQVTATAEAEIAREIEHRRPAEGAQAYDQGLGDALAGEVAPPWVSRTRVCRPTPWRTHHSFLDGCRQRTLCTDKRSRASCRAR